MAAADVILTQIEVLRQDLYRVRKAVESQVIDAQLRGRVGARFDRELSRLDARQAALKARVAAALGLDSCWRELRQLENDSSKLFDECLAFMQGALARNAGLDEGICARTDELLDELAHLSDVGWGRFTLLATSEFYRDTAEIIRVRYPEVSLWSLPLAAHEFGHFVGPELRQSENGGYIYPLQVRLKAADESRPVGWPLPHTQRWHHIQEHFADLFATYTLGPAFAAAFIILRLNPSEASLDSVTHPAGARRVHGILWTLEKIDEREGSALRRPFRDVTARLREVWQENLRQAGQPEKLGDAEAALVTAGMAESLDLLIDATPQRLALRRDDWLRAEALSSDLAPAALPDGLTRRDVLNAVWLARLQSADQGPYVLNDIAGKAMATYRRI